MKRIIFIFFLLFSSSIIFSQTKNEVPWPTGNWYEIYNGDTIYMQFSPGLFSHSYIVGQFRQRFTISGTVERKAKDIFLITYNPRPHFEGSWIRIKFVDGKLFVVIHAFRRGLSGSFKELIPN